MCRRVMLSVKTGRMGFFQQICRTVTDLKRIDKDESSNQPTADAANLPDLQPTLCKCARGL